MKHRIKGLVIISIVLLLIISGYLFIYAFSFDFEEISYRLAKYHNYIDIVVRLDGTQLNMKGIKVNYIHDNGDVLEKSVFDDYYEHEKTKRVSNRVKFKEGAYGVNIFEIIIPKEDLKDFDEDIKLSIGHFNTNWWHVNKYSVDVDINVLSKESVDVTISQKISDMKDPKEVVIFNDKITKQLTTTDASISTFVGP